MVSLNRIYRRVSISPSHKPAALFAIERARTEASLAGDVSDGYDVSDFDAPLFIINSFAIWLTEVSGVPTTIGTLLCRADQFRSRSTERKSTLRRIPVRLCRQKERDRG